MYTFPAYLSAQYIDVGMLIGVSNYQGDLAKSSVKASVGRSRQALNINARYNYTRRVSFKLGLNYGVIAADDKDALKKRVRNLYFESNIYELSLTTEISVFKYDPTDLGAIRITPYILGGISVFHFNPVTKLNGDWVSLHDYHTEGQGLTGYPEEYKLTQLAIPFGGGVKYNINEEWSIGIEMAMRMTFTDYLDDVSGYYPNLKELHDAYGSDAVKLSNPNITAFSDSTDGLPEYEPYTIARGVPENTDWYFFGGVTFSYNFLFKGMYSSASNSGHLGCPAF